VTDWVNSAITELILSFNKILVKREPGAKLGLLKRENRNRTKNETTRV